ncbi:hypothetical protein BGW39_006300 [Mortierella sp. 14UC]|nr:hypothetical protein BGW39_006300 [Mortierella sp. 14UC]
MNYYQCAVCSLPFQSHIASMYCSERCYIVNGMAYYYQSFANTNQPSPTTTIAAAPASNWSSWACASPSSPASGYDADINHTTPSSSVRKNKALPPPTLSPILMPTLPTPSQSSRRTTASSTTATRSRSSSMVSAGSWHSGDSMNTSVSGGANSNFSSSGDGSEEDPLSGNWPKMDIARRTGLSTGSSTPSSSSSFDRQLDSNGQAQWDPITMGWTSATTEAPTSSSSQTRFELPLPASFLLHAESSWESEEHLLSSPSAWSMSSTPRKYLALSASIWGPGWHQVEPLPPSFVKTLEQSELELQAQAQALALEKAALAAANPKAIAKKAKREAKAAAAAAAAALVAQEQQGDGQSQDSVMVDGGSCQASLASSTSPSDASTPASALNALCSSRLPRSLQFVD